MQRVWLALLVLLATFSSAPAGSVQQGAFDRLANSAPPALAVARSDGESAVAELLADLPTPAPDPPTALAAQPSPAWPPSASASWPAHPLPADRVALPSLLDRLPYDATAPPLRG
jgi:hypothetical protein